MPTRLSWASLLLVSACAGPASTVAAPVALLLPDSTTVLDAATGAPLNAAELLRRVAAADFVLLGEFHDNGVHHQARGALLAASAGRPSVVFEQFPRSATPIQPPAAGEDREAWLDAHGFDRKNWQWPLHEPVVDAAIAVGRSLRGSGLSREMLRSVVREGTGAAPPELRALLEQSPLDSAARAAIDAELMAGHCGKLPASMMPGMRAAQEVRDAAMADALLAGGVGGPAWLIAGNGHVRMDMGVPRLLRQAAPGKTVLAVGLLERGTAEAVPGAAAGQLYDVLIITPPAEREDPCLGL
jgi:uncharacterized iron-regulated protein